LILTETSSNKREIFQLPYGSRVRAEADSKVPERRCSCRVGSALKTDHTEMDGTIELKDIKEGVTLHKEKSKITGQIERVIIEHSAERMRPRIIIKKGGKQVARTAAPGYEPGR